MKHAEILAKLNEAVDKGEIKSAVSDGHRYYTDAITETLHIPITKPQETLEAFHKLYLMPKANPTTTADKFSIMPRVSMFIGQPDTGKSYEAQKIAEDCGVPHIFIMCRDNLNLETLLEDFVLVDGKPVFQESLALKMLAGTERGILIFDEFNTLLTGVMKTLQPLFDDTSKTFVYRGKVYKKNLQCKVIVTLNDKDKGISIVPDAILSRSYLRWFQPVNVKTLAEWTGVPMEWITNLWNIFKALGALNIFGTRQIKMLRNYATQKQIKNHFYGLCRMKNIPTTALDQVQVQRFINKL